MKSIDERHRINNWSSRKILPDKIGNERNRDAGEEQILAMTGEEKGKWKAQKGLLVHRRSKRRRSGCRGNGRLHRRTPGTKERAENETKTKKAQQLLLHDWRGGNII